MESLTYDDFNARIASFPCLFNQIPVYRGAKIKGIKIKLENELDVDDDSLEEIIEKLNFYTWIEFNLDDYAMAHQHNQAVFDLTAGKNITCLVNRALVSRKRGDEMRAEQCLAQAEKLRSGSDGEKLMTEVDAELAYSLSRLSGAEYLNRAIELYTEVVTKQPQCYAWKFGLGLLHRRATHRNVFSYMASNKTIIEHVEKAVELLYDVARKSTDLNLRGRAYAQLAVMRSQSKTCFGQSDCTRLFGETNVKSLIEKAQKYGSNDAWTLTECGRIIRYTDLNFGTLLLERSLSIKKHSTTLHHLGMCYEENAKRRAKSEAKMWNRNYGASLMGTQNVNQQTFRRQPERFQAEIPESSAMRCPLNKLPLKSDDPYVVIAIDYYQQAIDISYDNNNPARYSLGILLKQCGDLEEALKQFNQIIHLTSTNDGASSKRSGERSEYLNTVTAAYEQAGLCLLELARHPGTTEAELRKLNENAEKKLLKAVSLSTTLSRLDSIGKRPNKQKWNAFRTLETRYEGDEHSPEVIKKYIDLLSRVSRYEKIPEVIERLRSMCEGDLADPRVIKSGLESYLALKQYEAAYVFLLTYETSPHFGDCPEQLDWIILKVRLCFAAALDCSAKLILKIWFDSYIAENNEIVNDDGEIAENTSPRGNDVLDVLIVGDENGEETAETEETVNKLQQIISGDFGLAVDNIRDAVANSGRTLLNELQLQEIAKARVVLVLLREKQSRLFTSLLEFIPTIIIDCRENGRPEPKVLLGLTDDRVKIPPLLKKYNQMALWDILERIQVSAEDLEEDPKIMHPDTRRLDAIGACHYDFSGVPEATNVYPSDCLVDTVSQSSSGEFNDCVIAKMSLYCCLINKECSL